MQPIASSSKHQLPAHQLPHPGSPQRGTPHKPRWMQYGGYYRQIEDTTRPWVPSPRVSSPMPAPNMPVFDINLNSKAGEVSSLNSRSSSSTWSTAHRPSIHAQLRAAAVQEASLPKKKRFASLRRIARKLGVRRTRPRTYRMAVLPVRRSPCSSRSRRSESTSADRDRREAAHRGILSFSESPAPRVERLGILRTPNDKLPHRAQLV
jgi:hypothetical protein